MTIEIEPTLDEMKRAHQCMQTLLVGLRQARAHGGVNAKMHVGDVIRVIEQFKLGKPGDAAKREVTGPFYPEQN